MSLNRSTPFLLPVALLLTPVFAGAQSTDRSKLLNQIEELRSQIKQKEAQLLAVSDQDRAAYSEFLSQRDSGICRLMPREDFDGKLLISGGGAYYSFRKPSSEYGYGSQLGLERGQFRTGFAGADFGYIVDLGDFEPGSVTLDTAPVKALASFVPPNLEADVRAEQGKSYQGFKLQNYIYKRTAPASPGHTYVVRAIEYDQADTIVAFRALRRDDDGSIVLIWKILATLPAPQLVRAEVR